MKIIACSGIARSGKNTFCDIAEDILTKNRFKVKQYSFAEQLRKEVAPFLKDICGVDVWTTDTELKNDIRDFLVWYGTTWWRKRDPKRWIREVDNQIKLDGNKIDIFLVSDVRYPNEAEWVHSWGGYLVHVAAYKRELLDRTIRTFSIPPNEQERINDPLVRSQADYKLEWEAKGLSPKEAFKDEELRREVLKVLNACDYFTEPLSL